MFCAGVCDVGARSGAADDGSSSALNVRRPGKERHYGGSQQFVLQDKGLTNEISDVTFVGGVCLRRDHLRGFFERGFSRIHPQFPHYDLRSG